MEAKLCGLLLVLQIVIMVSATSRPLTSNVVGVALNQPVSYRNSHYSGFGFGSKKEYSSNGGVKNAAYSRLSRMVGSRPPSCERKCYGCTPCEAIQVPAISKSHSKIGLDYANYEPEGWKCKCGPSLYSP